MLAINKNQLELSAEQSAKQLDDNEKSQDKFAKSLDQKDQLNHVDATNNPNISVSTPKTELSDETAINALDNKFDTANAIDKLVVKPKISTYKLEEVLFEVCNGYKSIIADKLYNDFSSLIGKAVESLLQSVSSYVENWLQKIDYSPLITVLENIQKAFDCNYQNVKALYLQAMFDAKWFPYAGWIANYKVLSDFLTILSTTRASKNRTQRIDKLFFSYYNKNRIADIKREWRHNDLPKYMIRILIQSVQAYHRKEYALTVSTLSTLWEGIIQEKANDDSFRISNKTRDNLTALINDNNYDRIFSSFCEEYIFYNCKNKEEVIPDVPGRHGIVHAWYNKYPSKKAALNAILFTDFLLKLQPNNVPEEKENG